MAQSSGALGAFGRSPVSRPIAWTALATGLAASAHRCADSSLPCCNIESQTGIAVFALLAATKSIFKVLRWRCNRLENGDKSWAPFPALGHPNLAGVCRRRKRMQCLRPGKDRLRRRPRKTSLTLQKLRLELHAAQGDSSSARAKARAAELEKSHLEARCKRSEDLYAQLHANYTSVLSRLDRCERDEAHIRQEILKLALAAPGASLLQPEEGLDVSEFSTEAFAFAPRTPSLLRDVGNGHEPRSSVQSFETDSESGFSPTFPAKELEDQAREGVDEMEMQEAAVSDDDSAEGDLEKVPSLNLLEEKQHRISAGSRSMHPRALPGNPPTPSRSLSRPWQTAS